MLETMSQPNRTSQRGSVQGADPLGAEDGDFDLGEIDSPEDEAPVAAGTIEPPDQAPDPDPPATPVMAEAPDADRPTVVTHTVLRSFSGAGLVRLPGELVDATQWRTVRSLEAMRYIAAVDPASPPQVMTTSDGRSWADLDQAVSHEETLVSTPDS